MKSKCPFSRSADQAGIRCRRAVKTEKEIEARCLFGLRALAFTKNRNPHRAGPGPNFRTGGLDAGDRMTGL